MTYYGLDEKTFHEKSKRLYETVKIEPKGLRITEHAVIRFKERVKHMSTEKVRWCIASSVSSFKRKNNYIGCVEFDNDIAYYYIGVIDDVQYVIPYYHRSGVIKTILPMSCIKNENMSSVRTNLLG